VEAEYTEHREGPETVDVGTVGRSGLFDRGLFGLEACEGAQAWRVASTARKARKAVVALTIRRVRGIDVSR
jgi:hypothetical protein